MITKADVPVYNCSVLFLIEPTEKEWTTFCKKKRIQDDTRDDFLQDIKNENVGGSTSRDLNPIVYIRDRHMCDNIAHVIFHAAHRILHDRGVALDNDGEAYAYLVGYLTKMFYKAAEDL